MPTKRTSETDSSVSRGASTAPRRQTAAKPRVKRTETATAAPLEITATPSDLSAKPYAGPSPEDIALLAYSFWESRGCQGGTPEEDWLRAEKQLSVRASAAIG